MHPFSILTLGIFVAGYITARWDLVTRLYELAIFAWDHGVVVSVVVADLRQPLSPPPLEAWLYVYTTLFPMANHKLHYIDTNTQRLRLSVDLLLPPCRSYQFARVEGG